MTAVVAPVAPGRQGVVVQAVRTALIRAVRTTPTLAHQGIARPAAVPQVAEVEAVAEVGTRGWPD